MIRVLVIAEVRLYRDGIAQVLDSRPGITVIGTARGVQEAVTRLSEQPPNVVLIDVTRSENLATVRFLAQLMPRAKIVVLGLPEIEGDIIACAEAGMAGYVLRDGSSEDLVLAVEAAAHGELACTPNVAAMLLRGVGRPGANGARIDTEAPLTRRELEIALLIGEGLQNKQIASRLYLALPTVKNHVHNILAKVGVSSRSEVAAWMSSRGSRVAEPSRK